RWAFPVTPIAPKGAPTRLGLLVSLMGDVLPIQSSATAKAKTVSSSAARFRRRSDRFCRSALGREGLYR
ncbi:hypothetical protein VDG05_17330, partial [Xanthomonas campestris pv. raphani]